MSKSSADFNYKVALASGLKSLQAGRLRQAEEQFRYLMTHFPAADGGYRGLAKVLLEQEDRPGALRTLLDGGAALAKSGARSGAITLYREAVSLDPGDLTAHRRLAAALTLAGETDDAARENQRFIDGAIAAGDMRRADLERAYASAAAASNGHAVVPETAETSGSSASTDERAAPLRSTFGGPGPRREPEPAAEPMSAWMPQAPTPMEMPAPAPLPADVPADADAQTVEAAAAAYLAQGDPRGGSAALEAARRYIADGRMDAASDLLLQLIAAGIADHDAQRLLLEVTKNIGKKDVAKAKIELLVQALRLDGRGDLAAEVEQLAQAF